MLKKIWHFHPVTTQLMKFGIIGGSSSTVNFVVVVLLVEFAGLHPLLANIFAFLTAFMVSYFGHHYWTFAHKGRTFSKSLPKFFSVAVLSFTLNESLYAWILKLNIFSYWVSLLIVIGVVACLTFTLSKFWAFRVKGRVVG